MSYLWPPLSSICMQSYVFTFMQAWDCKHWKYIELLVTAFLCLIYSMPCMSVVYELCLSLFMPVHEVSELFLMINLVNCIINLSHLLILCNLQWFFVLSFHGKMFNFSCEHNHYICVCCRNVACRSVSVCLPQFRVLSTWQIISLLHS